ncbi:MAG: copper amine oxidase N-terminal domain-containing protein [Clostridiales bacterium]|jgi:hypothetical protein|nr:copper amine oxidase N-terminal domain-containing protein [Clostridiales bacterium]
MKRKIKAALAMLLAIVFSASVSVVSFASDPNAPRDSFPASVDELEPVDTIPNPFEFFDSSIDPNGNGIVDDADEWEIRRQEIKELVQYYWLGYQQPTPKEGSIYSHTSEQVENPISLLFQELKESLATGSGVEIYALANGAKGEVTETFPPKEDATDEELEAYAIEVWNSGYAVLQTNGTTWVLATTRSGGDLTEAPAETLPNDGDWITVSDNGNTSKFKINIYTPEADKVKPEGSGVLIGIGKTINDMQIESMLDRGYSFIYFTYGDVYADNASRSGVYTDIYPYSADEYEYDSGALMGWAWGVSRIIDALENEAADNGGLAFGAIDPTKTAVIGHSRCGKAAMFAAAFDDRITIAFPSEPGGSGIQSYRYAVEGKIFNYDVADRADHVFGRTEIPTISLGSAFWFSSKALEFRNKDNLLPFDPAAIIALCAPRAFFASGGNEDHWLGNEGAVASVIAAQEVYNFLGVGGNIGVRSRESNHSVYNRDFPFYLAIMSEFWESEGLHYEDIWPDGTDGQLWSVTYNDKVYDSISEMNSYPFDIASSYIPWASADKYVLWTEADTVITDIDTVVTAHSDAPGVILVLPDGTELEPTSEGDGEFSFSLTTDIMDYGRYELRTVGTEKTTNNVYFGGITLSDALRHGTVRDGSGGFRYGSNEQENREVGFASRVADGVELYVNGEQKTVSPYSGRNDKTAYSAGLLAYGLLFHDTIFADMLEDDTWDSLSAFTLKHLQFPVIPGYTFEMSFSNIQPGGSAAASGNDEAIAATFDTPISWPVSRYNNGPMEVWPQVPDFKGDTGERPTAPDPVEDPWGPEVTCSDIYEPDSSHLALDITFDTEVNPSELGIGFTIAEKWETSWNEDNKTVTFTFDKADVSDEEEGNLIIFRLKKPQELSDFSFTFRGTAYTVPNGKDIAKQLSAPIMLSFPLPVEEDEEDGEEGTPGDSGSSGGYYAPSYYEPAPSTSISRLVSAPTTTTDISKALSSNVSVDLSIPAGREGLALTGETLLKVESAGKPLNIKGSFFTLSLPAKAIAELSLTNSSAVEIWLSKSTSAPASQLAAKLQETSTLNANFLKQLYTVNIVVDGKVIPHNTQPFLLEFDASSYEGQIESLTGVLYSNGIASYKQLGGEYLASRKTFQFWAYESGVYGVIASAKISKLVFTIGDQGYKVNGSSSLNDAAPYISSDSRTMVPLRAISEALGANVTWNDATKGITISTGGTVIIRLTLGQQLPNGLGALELVNDRTFVPIRYVAEHLGANVVWNEADQSVQIYQ